MYFCTLHCFNRRRIENSSKAIIVLQVKISVLITSEGHTATKMKLKAINNVGKFSHDYVKDRIQNCLDSEITTT